MSNFRFRSVSAFPPIIKNLIIINVIVWVAQLIFDREDGQLTFWLTSKLALYPINSEEFKPYQIATHMFAHQSYDGFPAHISLFHILFNMLVLFMFGRMLEYRWGPKRFLIFYLACGVGAAAAHLLMQYIMGGYSMAIGASGAVMGVVIGFAYLFPNTEVQLMGVLPIKMKWLALIYIAIDLLGGFGQLRSDKVAHFAHLGGALTGFILIYYWNKTNRRSLY